MKSLSIVPIRTQIFGEGQSLLEFISASVPQSLIRERMILAVTSKIVSLAEGCTVDKSGVDKSKLVESESDVFFGEVGYGCFLTIKEGLFIPSAGIDESNSESGKFILYPKNPAQSAQNLWVGLRKKWNLNELGILLTDSRTSPLRKGVTGVALAHAGFHPVLSRIGSKDLFGRELKMTQINFADAYSAAAVVVMGEGDESQPLAVISGVGCEFGNTSNPDDLRMPLKEDLYYPFFKSLIVD